jgi:hypothetical protein
MKWGWLMALLVACGADHVPLPDASPDAGAPSWSCRMFVDCAGSAQIVTSSVSADTETAAETQLVDQCEAMTCSGALACHAICSM